MKKSVQISTSLMTFALLLGMPGVVALYADEAQLAATENKANDAAETPAAVNGAGGAETEVAVVAEDDEEAGEVAVLGEEAEKEASKTLDVSGADASDEEVANIPEELAKRNVESSFIGGSYVPVYSGKNLLDTLASIACNMKPVRALRLDLLSEEQVNLLKGTVCKYSAESIPSDKAFKEVLRNTGIEYYDNGGDNEILLGDHETVSEFIRYTKVGGLSANHTLLTVDFVGGWTINEALKHIADEARIDINYDYMEPKYRDLELREVDTDAGTHQVNSKEQPKKGQVHTVDEANQGNARVITTYSNKTPMEWRYIISEVLKPIQYTFIEEDGTVCPMSFARYREHEQSKIDAKPLETKVINLHHVSPERVVELFGGETKGKAKTNGIIKHKDGYIKVVTEKKDYTSVYKSTSSSMSLGEGTTIGAEDNNAKFSDLARPRTAPAVIVCDIHENIPVVEEQIAMIDVPEKQILIEALILNVDDNTSKQLGVLWSGFDRIGAGAKWEHSRRNVDTRASINEHFRNDAQSAVSTSSRTRGEYADDETLRDELPRRGSYEQALSTYSHNSGNWSGSDNGYEVGEYSDGVFSVGTVAAPILDGITDMSQRITSSVFSGVVGPFDLAATVNLVRENGESQILASPVIVLGDHTESVIKIGQALPVPVRKVVYESISSDRTVPIDTYEWIQVLSGHTLWIAPEITADGKMVRLSVHPQICDADEDQEYWVSAPDGSRYPKVRTRELDTRVSVPSGETLLLGGLIQSQNTVVKKKIWLLGDIPFIGRLFRWNSTGKIRSNLMILIRPTILDPEKPNTGFESPSLKMIKPLEVGVGRDMRLPEKDTSLEDNEKAIIDFFKPAPVEENNAGLVEPKSPEAEPAVGGAAAEAKPEEKK